MDKTKELINKANIFFETLSENMTKEKKSEWFIELGSYTSAIFRSLSELQKSGIVNNHEFALVYLRQFMSILSFLINVFVKEVETGDYYLEAKFFVINQMQYSMKGIQEDIMEANDKSEDNLLGCFIKLVDYALDKISEIYDSESTQENLLNISSDAKIIFSELMTHAMIIAQICSEEDSKMIKGSCQSVIDTLQWTIKEIEKQNCAMMNLSVQACSDKICILERRVNNAVLKLTLKVFSEYKELIEKIQKHCFDFSNVEQPIAEFACLIEDHDIQVDRIIQIGLFAVSCSTDKSNAVKIRSCLSILESLESEVIPSFAAVLRKQTYQSKNLAILFKDLWIRQISLLEGFVFRVIDPFAFCQLVYDENKEILNEYCRNLNKITSRVPVTSSHHQEVLNNLEPIKKIISHTRLLMAIIETEQDTHRDDDFHKAYQDFKNVYNEVKWVYVILNQKKDIESHLKSWKRCKILQTTISTLKQHFLDEDSQEIDAADASKDSVLQKGNDKRDGITENPFLCHIINRGRENLKDRSNLHPESRLNESLKTIQKITDKKMKEIGRHKKLIPLSKYVHLRKISSSSANISTSNSVARKNSPDANNSSRITNYSALEVSDIIMELNNITGTFFNLTKDKDN